MAFDLARVVAEIEAAPLVSPYTSELATAVICDVFRMAGQLPMPAERWRAWTGKKAASPLLGEQSGMLAHFLACSSLRPESVESVASLPAPVDAVALLDGFFATIEPLTAEMIRSNTFRREEFLRRWIEALGGRIAGETPAQSQKRLVALDYRKTLAEFRKAESSRLEEARRREEALRKAAEEAAARGWRE
jgi:hypothetical protein